MCENRTLRLTEYFQNWVTYNGSVLLWFTFTCVRDRKIFQATYTHRTQNMHWYVYCANVETGKHFLIMECLLYDDLRYNLFKECSKLDFQDLETNRKLWVWCHNRQYLLPQWKTWKSDCCMTSSSSGKD